MPVKFNIGLLCWLLLTATQAQAGDVAMIHAKAITGGVSQEALDELTRLLAMDLRERGVGVHVLGDADPGIREQREGRRHGLESMVQQGKRAVLQRRFDESVDKLQTVIRELWNAPELLANVDMLREAYAYVALGYYSQGKEEEARLALAQLVRLNPEWESIDVGTDIGLSRIYSKVRASLLRSRPGILQITSDLPRTEAFLNDHPLGLLPVKLEGVIPGRHVLRLQVGDLSYVQHVQVLTDDTLEINNAWAHGVAELAAISARENRMTPTQRQALLDHALRSGAFRKLVIVGVGRDDSGVSIGGLVGQVGSDNWQAMRVVNEAGNLGELTKTAALVAKSVQEAIGATGPGLRGTARLVGGWPSHASEESRAEGMRVVQFARSTWSASTEAIEPKVAGVVPPTALLQQSEGSSVAPVIPLLGTYDRAINLDVHAELKASKKPFWKTWWFWTAVGIGAGAAAGIGSYFLVQDSRGHGDTVALEASWGR